MWGGQNEGRALGAAVQGIPAEAAASGACARRSLRVPSPVTWRCRSRRGGWHPPSPLRGLEGDAPRCSFSPLGVQIRTASGWHQGALWLVPGRRRVGGDGGSRPWGLGCRHMHEDRADRRSAAGGHVRDPEGCPWLSGCEWRGRWAGQVGWGLPWPAAPGRALGFSEREAASVASGAGSSRTELGEPSH